MDAAAFEAFLANPIGPGQPAIDLLGTVGGVVDEAALLSITVTDFGDMWENLVKHAHAMRPAHEALHPIFPFLSKRRLFVFRLYLEYRVRSNANADGNAETGDQCVR